MSEPVASAIVLVLAALGVMAWGLGSQDTVKRLAAWCVIAALVGFGWLVTQAKIASYASR